MQPDSPQKAPYPLELAAGDYFWCACGKSTKQPFCDGSHKGSAFVPQKFTVAATQKVFLCGCKHTKTAPFCDGAHKQLT